MSYCEQILTVTELYQSLDKLGFMKNNTPTTIKKRIEQEATPQHGKRSMEVEVMALPTSNGIIQLIHYGASAISSSPYAYVSEKSFTLAPSYDFDTMLKGVLESIIQGLETFKG